MARHNIVFAFLALSVVATATQFASANTATSAPKRRQVYMVNNPVIFPEQILVADRDGSNLQQILQAGRGVSDIEVFEDYIYWTENYTTSVRRANLDGSNVETIYRAPPISPAPFPASLTIDPVGRRVYWSSQMVGQIRSANLDGSDERLFSSPIVQNPYAVEVDPIGGHLYWTEYFAKQVWRSDLDGSDSTLLFQDSGVSPTLFGLALDHDERKMYWTNNERKVVRRANFDGSNVETIITGSSQSKYTDIEIDPISRQLLFIDDRKGINDRSYVLQSNMDGTDTQTIADVFGHMVGIAVSVPEPSTACLACSALAAVGVLRSRRPVFPRR
jgi:hypothetical protein